MALTATATQRLRTQVSTTLGMVDELVVCVSPYKENIMYAVGTFITITQTFRPMVERLRHERAKFPRTIIYCRRYEDCSDLYDFKDKLGRDFTDPSGTPDLPRLRRCERQH